MIVPIIAAGLVALSALIALYYVALALASLRTGARPPAADGESRTTFAIVIPAHNEESGILDTLRSCAELDYPSDRYRVYVIADNCTDRTAEIAAGAGATCLVRNHETDRGKGFALAWAFERVLPERPDAIVVLDADCSIDRHALRAFDRRIARGDRVLQANDSVANPDESIISYATAVGNSIENDLFYAGKSAIGLAVFLRGTGMVFQRDVLEQLPWHASSAAEDAEFTLRLIRHGVPIRFVGEAHVRSRFPARVDELVIQRSRWASGNFSLGKAHALGLIGSGVVRGRLALADAGWTLLVVSRPLVLLGAAAALGAAALCLYLAPGTLANGLFAAAAATILALALYFALGIVRFGLTVRRMALLFGAPVVVFQLLAISLASLASGRGAWVRSPRAATPVKAPEG